MLLGLQAIVAVISIVFLRISLIIDSESKVTIAYASTRILSSLIYVGMQIYFRYKTGNLDLIFAVAIGIYSIFESLLSGQLISFYCDTD